MNRQLLFKIYWKLQAFIVPELKYSQALYEDVLKEYCQEKPVWLDLGCGHNLLPPWRIEQEKELINNAKLILGLDYDFRSLINHGSINHRVRGDITNLPFLDDSFDLVTSNMVFEHLSSPGEQLEEIRRVLKRGGKLIFHTPNLFGYTTIVARMIPESIKKRIVNIVQDREPEDVFRTHYKINSPRRIKKLANSAGFRVSSIRSICSSPQLVICPPLLVFELLWIKFLMTEGMKIFRTNIIAVLEKT